MTDAPFTETHLTAIEDEYAMDEREAADRIRELIDAYRAALAEIDRLTAALELRGMWPNGVHRAFVEGAAWWEFHESGGTMFPSDRDLAEAEAVKRYGEPKSEKTP
jgi:hypothetical protein